MDIGFGVPVIRLEILGITRVTTFRMVTLKEQKEPESLMKRITVQIVFMEGERWTGEPFSFLTVA